jgi:hypothetical protein
MASKIQREIYYAKLLTKSRQRHLIKDKFVKKENIVASKQIDWNKLNNYVNKKLIWNI